MSNDNNGDEKVRIFPTGGDVDPQAILAAARNQPLTKVVVIGWTPEGNLFLSSSCDKVRDMHWLLSNGIDELWRAMRDGG